MSASFPFFIEYARSDFPSADLGVATCMQLVTEKHNLWKLTEHVKVWFQAYLLSLNLKVLQ